MDTTPRANRLHIGVYGRRNAGKSSLINFITGQAIALVSETPGTTTDPVLKSMELLPLGPVVFVDTAGLDDEGSLGELRVTRTREMIGRTDLALLLVPADKAHDLEREPGWLQELRLASVPVLGVLGKADLLTARGAKEESARLASLLGIPFVSVSAKTGGGRTGLMEAIVKEAPTDFERPTILGDIVRPGERVALVAPQDIQAPKGRLILPQVQTLRDLLDHHAMAFFSTMSEFAALLEALKSPPDLVITDSQVFAQVNALLDRETPLTSFSILMARYKGDLATFARGARKIASLKDSDSVLIAEACTHHELEGDIGRSKLPGWLREIAGQNLTVDVNAGAILPDDLSRYALIIHCGACMFTRKQLMSRIIRAEGAGVPITNYGTAIAAVNGILERVLEVFPEARDIQRS